MRDKTHTKTTAPEWTITQEGPDALGLFFMVRRNGEPWTSTRSMSEARHHVRRYERETLQHKDWPETPDDTLTNKLMSLTESQQRRALNFLWGTMVIRDPQACIDAMAFAGAREDSE